MIELPELTEMDMQVRPSPKGVQISAAVIVSWSDMADAVAQADSAEQAEFFEYLAISLSGMGPGRWAMQCRAIAEDDRWLPTNRARIAGQLETLAEHMREDVEQVD